MQNKIYDPAKSRLGFGCMRLPLDNPEKQGEINLEKFNEMVDAYLASGFNYFDTAYMYNDFQSENAIRESLVKRHKRDSFTLADKMPTMLLQSKEDVERIFNEQLVKCGVEYFDYYLIHNLSTHHYEIAKKFDCFEFVKEMKRQGKIRHIGFSYHDDAILLEKILNEHPEVEFVQIQLNYIDWENESIQSRKCYETIRRHNLPAIIMEPLKGGALIRVPNEVRELFSNYETSHGIVSKNPGSPAAWGLRFAASHDGIMAVLSGMSTIEQMEENLTFMKDFKPMTAEEFDIIKQATDILNKSTEIQCTACRYCVRECPQEIAIPEYFALYNNNASHSLQSNFNIQASYYGNLTKTHGKASDCISCRACEAKCPQHLKISELMQKVAAKFDATND